MKMFRRRGLDRFDYFAWDPPAELGTDPMSALATYNAEVARGIVHTPEWTALMAEAQASYDAQVGAIQTELTKRYG